MSEYKPGMDVDKITDVFYPGSGARWGMTSHDFAAHEEEEQRSIAEGSQWLIARSLNHDGERFVRGDSREALEGLGFRVVGEHNELFYEVVPPDGWKKSTEGFWTYVFDTEGKERLSQFFKGAIYDRRAHVSVTS